MVIPDIICAATVSLKSSYLEPAVSPAMAFIMAVFIFALGNALLSSCGIIPNLESSLNLKP